MKKLTQRLFIVLVLGIAVFALSAPAERVEAGGSDCQVAGQVCRDISEGLYQLCINVTGDYAACALQEAQSTINCMSGAGCPLQ